jgi:predicted PurR-regulated permease PerM
MHGLAQTGAHWANQDLGMTASIIPLRPLGAAAAYGIIAATTIGMLYYGRALLMPLAVAILIWHLINALAATYHRPVLGGRHLPSWLCYIAALTTIFGALFNPTSSYMAVRS